MSDFKFRKKFTEQLSDLLEGDINLLEAINILSNSFGGKFRDKIFHLKYCLEKGKDFEVSFSIISKDKEFLTFIKTGERTGNLKRVLKLLKEKYNFIQEIKSEILMIITYPTIVIIVAIIILNVLLLVVVPKFVEIYNDLDNNLPIITKVVLNLSDFMIKKWQYLITILISIVLYTYFLFKYFKNLISRIIINIPIFKEYIVLSFTQTMYAAFASKIRFIEALQLCINIDNIVFKNELVKILKKIEKGNSISQSFKNSKYFDNEYKSYITIADRTGELENTFKTLSVILNNRLKYKIKLYLKFLEPISIVLIAIFVGIIVLAIMLPLFSLGENIG